MSRAPVKPVALAALSAMTAASLWASSAWPCGAPFGAGVNVDPKQDIIVVHKAGTETYVFQPTFCGEAKDFGLILPVPSVLSSAPELSDEKAFAAADQLSKPTVVKKTECMSRGGVGGGMDAGFGGTDGTTVVASGRVGFLDWTQLKADSEASFTSWLDANGYAYDPAAKSAFASYVTKGWYFLAFKINQGAPTGSNNCRALGPVKLAFPTTTPVVPSRIATAGQTLPSGGYAYGFSWRVFAITDASGQIGFADAESSTRKLGFAGALTEGDASKLAGLAAAGDRMTKLTLWFDKTVTEDVAFARKAPSDFRETVYDVTYVDCSDGGVPDSDAGDDGGVGPQNQADQAAGGAGCATARGSSGWASALALLAVAIARVRRHRAR
ncbi:MAG: DUF2330 domain-containing protein [Deltaproteobacteria bacterium]|nr:DUF2330 domain-containing protein [Deltaproteobacteria bacterium]